VSDAITNERFIDQAGSAAATLRQGGYDRALGLFGSDMDRDFSAQAYNQDLRSQYDQGLLSRAGLEAGIAGQMGSRMDQEASMLTGLGSNARLIDQAGLDANYNEFLRAQQDPFNRAQVEMGLLSSTPIITDSNSTSTQSQNPGLAGIAGLGLQGASLFMGNPAAAMGGVKAASKLI
ncbi:MAG: hypothetical protein AAF141_13385, partial [Pseudomonadota bacterium]